MVYAMVWQASHSIWYSLADIAWYRVWPGEVCHGMWKGMSVGGPVHTYQTRSQVEGLLYACSHIQLLFTLGRDSR